MHLNWEGLRSRTQLTEICNLLTPNVKIVHTVTCNLRMQWKRELVRGEEEVLFLVYFTVKITEIPMFC